MIYVEIRFGPINGNAITIDKELSVTSDNAIANKPVALALKEINDKLSQVPQEVVSVADYNALTAITDPQTSVVYITEDTQDIWVWDGLVFVKSTGKIIDDTIYVNNVDELLTMQLTSDKYYNVFVPTSGQLAERYTLVKSNNGVSTLAGRLGYAISSWGNNWSWYKYSYEGHTHTTNDVKGLNEAIIDAAAGKQDKVSYELTTESKTIVGAINEVNKSRIIAINFYDVLDYAMWHNLIGDIQITAIDMTNIKAAFISDGDTLVRSNIVDLLKSGPISIANGKPITIEIERSYEGFAALTLKYK
jgi:hypothetical protein